METIEVYKVEVVSDIQEKIDAIVKIFNKRALNYASRENKRNGQSFVNFELLREDYLLLSDQYFNDQEIAVNLTAQFTQPSAQDILRYVGKKSENNLLDVDLLEDINNFESYTSLDELEHLVNALSTKFSDLTKSFKLSYKTAEARDTWAIQIGSVIDDTKKSIVIVGGMHADEWVATESLLYFAYAICHAYQNYTAIHYENLEFSANEVQTFVENYNLLLVPCLNPDGRAYTHSSANAVEWRKNRNEHDSGHIGVDINRNFNIAWELNKFKSVSSSDKPWSNVFHGEKANSEQETNNLIDIFDKLDNCRLYIDVHASGDWILMPWAIDSNQFKYDYMNYSNEKYNDDRGVDDPSYEEFMPLKDHMAHLFVAKAMNESIFLGSGTRYTLLEASSLYNKGISGASPDYAYSRHLENNQLNKILGFTLECGNKESDDIFSDKRPKPIQARKVIQETCSALIGACKALQEGIPDL